MKPPPLPRPRWILAYIILISFLALLDIYVIATTQNSASSLILRLTPLRTGIFAVSGVLMGTAAAGLFLRKAWSKWLILCAIMLHGVFTVWYNYLSIFEDGSVDGFEIAGTIFGFAVLGGIGGFIVYWPFSKCFRNYFEN